MDLVPDPRQKLKFLTLPGIKPGSPGWKAEPLPTTPRAADIELLMQNILERAEFYGTVRSN